MGFEPTDFVRLGLTVKVGYNGSGRVGLGWAWLGWVRSNGLGRVCSGVTGWVGSGWVGFCWVRRVWFGWVGSEGLGLV